MSELLRSWSSGVRWIDLADILIVSYIVYRALLLIKGTRAMQMLTGLGILGIGFFVSRSFELYASHWILSYFFDHLILIVVVLFQDDLRRALTHVGKNPFFAGSSREDQLTEIIEEVAKAARLLSREKIGALIVFEGETGLKNLIDTGSMLEARISHELIYSIFLTQTPIHDGAVILSGGRIAAAGCFLPLSKETGIDRKLGSRHRAALGLTEETDAVVVLCSEETGRINLVRSGQILSDLSEHELRESLLALLGTNRRAAQLPRRILDWFAASRRGTRGRAK